MKTIKKVHIGFLFLLMALLALSACAPEVQEDLSDHEGGDVSTDDEIPSDMVAIGHLAGYTIVRSDLGTEEEKQAAVALRGLMADSCGVAGIVTDWIEAVEFEIIIGDTTRPESAAAKEYALSVATQDDNWYYIGVDQNNIVLTGSDKYGIAAAVRGFMKDYEQQIKQGAVTLPKASVTVYQNDQPSLVVTEKGTGGEKSVFVATVHLGQAPYFPDTTGNTDATKIIAGAIDKASAMGGGVVYLPAGIYRISDTLTLPQHVTLRGDYVDPDRGSFADGTVLLVDKKMQSNKSVIVLSGASLAQGLTVYYEGQDIQNPVPYAATFLSANANSCWEIRDCTLINSYNGIHNAINPNGMVTVDNVKGTVLHTGYHMDQRADISICTDLAFSPVYWASAGEAWNAPAEADIRKLMKGNGSIGFYLGDCDRDTYENILLDGFATGMYSRAMTRAGVSGSYYNVQILDATVGIEAYGIDTRYGLILTNAVIDASDTAVINRTETDSRFCNVYLLNSEIKGGTEGSVKSFSSANGTEDTEYTAKSKRTPLPAERLFDIADYSADATGATNASPTIQKALDDAAAAGGGIVYLRPGRYLIEDALVIRGDNVQLLGTNQGTNTRSTSLTTGSILMVTYGREGDADATAALTIEGKNSGVTGITVIYPENGVGITTYESDPPVAYSYFLRATGKGSYINFVCMVAVSRAVHFDGANDFVCDRLLMTVYDQGIRVTNCYGGLISRIHTNGTYHTMGQECRNILGEDWLYNGAEVLNILDKVIVPRLTLLQLSNSADLQVLHVFHYGAQRYMDAENVDVLVLNGESSRLTGLSFALFGGVELTVMNFMRPNPSEYLSSEGENYIYLYNWGAAHYQGERVITVEP